MEKEKHEQRNLFISLSDPDLTTSSLTNENLNQNGFITKERPSEVNNSNPPKLHPNPTEYRPIPDDLLMIEFKVEDDG